MSIKYYPYKEEEILLWNSYLNKNKSKCRNKEVYDSQGNKKYVKSCGNPYMMDLN